MTSHASQTFFSQKTAGVFLSLLLVLLTAAGVPSAAYTAEAASADTTMAVHFLDVGQGLSILVQSRERIFCMTAVTGDIPVSWFRICRNRIFLPSTI